VGKATFVDNDPSRPLVNSKCGWMAPLTASTCQDGGRQSLATGLGIRHHPILRQTMRALDQKDVVRLLRSEVNRAGGQTKWAKKNGIAPSAISMVLAGDRPPNKKIISALKLRRVIVFERVDE
jgi:hypothetical protein